MKWGNKSNDHLLVLLEFARNVRSQDFDLFRQKAVAQLEGANRCTHKVAGSGLVTILKKKDFAQFEITWVLAGTLDVLWVHGNQAPSRREGCLAREHATSNVVIVERKSLDRIEG